MQNAAVDSSLQTYLKWDVISCSIWKSFLLIDKKNAAKEFVLGTVCYAWVAIQAVHPMMPSKT